MKEQVFAGHDGAQGGGNVVMVAIALTMLVGPALELQAVRWICAALLSSMPLVYALARYRLIVSDHGVTLRRAFGPIPWSSEKYNLEYTADLCEGWDSLQPEGVYLYARSIGWASPAFGPERDVAAMQLLVERVNVAIDAARRRSRPRRELNCEGLSNDDFRVLDRSPGGPPRRMMNVRRVRYRGVEIPVASMFLFNDEGWIDPRRVDRLATINLGGPTMFPNGLEVEAGAQLSYVSDKLTISGGMPVRVQIGGMVLDGGETLCMDIANRYGPLSYTLAEPMARGLVRLPAGTSIRQSYMDDGWCAYVGGPLALRDVHVYKGDTVYFDKSWRPTMVSLRRSRAAVTRVCLEGSLAAIPLRRNGGVDIRECRRRGLTSP